MLSVGMLAKQSNGSRGNSRSGAPTALPRSFVAEEIDAAIHLQAPTDPRRSAVFDGSPGATGRACSGCFLRSAFRNSNCTMPASRMARSKACPTSPPALLPNHYFANHVQALECVAEEHNALFGTALHVKVGECFSGSVAPHRRVVRICCDVACDITERTGMN